jgi:hypothetical protein
MSYFFMEVLMLHCLRVPAAATLLFCSLAPAVFAQTQTVVVPNQLATSEGNVGDSAWDSPIGVRWQQVYVASEFAAFGAKAIINQLAFRADVSHFNDQFPIVSDMDDLQVTLSTTSAAPTTLSSNFDDNFGADAKLVRSGPISFSLNTAFPTGPNAWSHVINFSQPFEYIPANGNLLLEIYRAHGIRNDRNDTVYFDASQLPNLPAKVAMVFASGQNLTQGEVSPFRGVVTRFGVGIPEPSTLGLGVFALCAVTRVRRRGEMLRPVSQCAAPSRSRGRR